MAFPVTVLLPVYNADATLDLALQSLCRQRFEAFEVVAVDDGSEDGTADILKRYAAQDRRVRPIFARRRGLVAALNTSLAHAEGRLVARMDADDVSHPLRLGLQQSYLHEHPDVSVVGSLIRFFPWPRVGDGFRIYQSWLNGIVDPPDIAREIFIESPLAHPSVMMRRSDLEAIGGYRDFGWPEDYDLWLRLHLADRRLAKVPRLLFYWREGPSRLTRRDGRYSVENFIRAKAHYLRLGPLRTDPRAVVWGAGQIGRRLSKHLQRRGVDLIAFVDIDPRKIGSTRRGAPIISPDDLPDVHRSSGRPLILAAVPSRGARALIRTRLEALGLAEGREFLCVA
ncbi:MAG: glycosyltransferase [Candidatus Latescibacteria bacterium]|jgi:glycosyltransferase involved in cell wall biosynthesis|nr:glycosyltransferase [Candidatus Latescibacterota bacterium]